MNHEDTVPTNARPALPEGTLKNVTRGQTHKSEEISDVVLNRKARKDLATPADHHGPIKTCGELSSLLEDPNFGNVGCLEARLRHPLTSRSRDVADETQLVELVLPPLDAPSAVIKTGAAIDAFNKATAEQGPSSLQGA